MATAAPTEPVPDTFCFQNIAGSLLAYQENNGCPDFQCDDPVFTTGACGTNAVGRNLMCSNGYFKLMQDVPTNLDCPKQWVCCRVKPPTASPPPTISPAPTSLSQ
jgi:hypothetical protein